MAYDENKFAPGIWEGLSALPEKVLGERTVGAAGDFIGRPIQTTYRGLQNLVDSVVPNYQFTPQDIANSVGGIVERGGIVPSAKQNSPVTGFSPEVTKALADAATTLTGAGGLPSPSSVKADIQGMNKQLDAAMKAGILPKSEYKFEEPISGTMMTPSAVPGIYQMPDGTYVNTSSRGSGGTAGLSPQEAYDRTMASSLRSLQGLPNTPAFAEMIKNAATELQGLGALKDLYKPQIATTPLGGKTATVGYDGTITPVGDTTGTYLSGKQAEADALANKTNAVMEQQERKQIANNLNTMHKNYVKAFSDIDKNALGPGEAYNAKRTLTKGYLQELGMDPQVAQVPLTVDNFVFEQEQSYKAAGKQPTDADRERWQNYYNKVAKPRFDKEYKSLMSRYFGTGK